MKINLKAFLCVTMLTVTPSMASNSFDDLMSEVRRGALTKAYTGNEGDILWLEEKFPFLTGNEGEKVKTFLKEAPCHRHDASDITMLSIVGGENSPYAKGILEKARTKGLKGNAMPIAWHGGPSEVWVLQEDFKVVLYGYFEQCEDESQFVLTKDNHEIERTFEKWLQDVYLGHEVLSDSEE